MRDTGQRIVSIKCKRPRIGTFRPNRASDKVHGRLGQATEHFIGTNGVKGSESFIQENGNLHIKAPFSCETLQAGCLRLGETTECC